MPVACRTEGCTVGETGICLLANDPQACEFRIHEAQDEASIENGEESEGIPAVLAAPNEKPTLWGSLPLDIDELRELMARRRCLLVGVVGTPAAGKTAALVSMYLLLSHGNLGGFQFADSKSLLAFEEISQGARRWGKSPPEEMTARTDTSGGRVAGFLHVQIKRIADDKLIDLLVPDMPGEWSDTLIDTNRADRLDFVRSADVVWLFVNGADLRDNTLRMYTLNRTNLLLQRVSGILGMQKAPVKIVISHLDNGQLSHATVTKLEKMAAEAGVDAEIIGIASFSNADGVAPGFGISQLINASLPVTPNQLREWPQGTPNAERFMLRYAQAERS